MVTVVAIPYRPDLGHRDRLFNHLQRRFWPQFDYEMLIGKNAEHHFNRSKAINAALNRPWDVAVIADGDTWVPEEHLRESVRIAKVSGRLTASFSAVVELDRPTTMDILNGKLTFAGSFGATRVRTKELETQSSMLAIPRALWDAVGGMDERFAGWGCEDNAFFKACEVLGGTARRIGDNAYHLWHPPAAGKFVGPEYQRNLALWRRYEQARTKKDIQRIASE